MKIAILTTSLDVTNGWGRYSKNLIDALRAEGASCLVFGGKGSNADDKDYYPILRSRPGAGVKNIVAGIYDFFQLRSRISDCDIVHVFTEPHILLAWLLGKPYVVSTHGTFALRLFEKPVFRWMAARAFRGARMVILTSTFTQERLAPHVLLRHVVLLPNGVDTQTFAPKQGTHRAEHTFITVGAIKPRKGQDVGIQAVARLKEKYPDITYVIVGENQSGAFHNMINAVIAEHRLERHIKFTGSISDEALINLYNTSAVYVQCSRVDETGSFEGYPLTLLEASACGLPVIGTDACASVDLLKDGENGFLIHQNSVDELVEKLDYLFANPEIARRMGQGARSVAEGLSWRRNAQKLLKIYEKSIIHA